MKRYLFLLMIVLIIPSGCVNNNFGNDGAETGFENIPATAHPVFAEPPQDSSGKEENHDADNVGEVDEIDNPFLVSRLPGVTKEMLKASFWLKQYSNAEDEILSQQEIQLLNEKNIKALDFMDDYYNAPATASLASINNMINRVSIRPDSDRYFNDGHAYTDYDYNMLKENLNLDIIKEENQVYFGISVRRTMMRSWPSFDGSFKSSGEYRIDRFMETAVYPAEPLVIYHISKDARWYLAKMYNYLAWIPVKDVALCSLDSLQEYLSEENRLVVSDAKILTSEYMGYPELSNQQLDMGVSFPLSNLLEVPDTVCDMNITGSYVVKYPVRNQSGLLEVEDLPIPAANGVNPGALEYSTKNILIQAFKFLGEPYGWGGMFNARDCSGFVMDVYRSCGIKLPRNSDQQELISADAVSMEGMGRAERETVLDGLRPGGILFMPGHEMIYLGKWNGEYYILHDVTTVYNGDGAVTLNQVSVTTLSVNTRKGTPFIMALTKAVEIG